MRLLSLVVASICFIQISSGQISAKSGFSFAKQFSKEIALYKAKEFVFKNILKESETVVKFQIDPLAAASSGELTSLVYKCEDKNKEGLVLGFFGSYWNDGGVEYTGYNFLDLPKEKATTILNKIEEAILVHDKYLNKDADNNNIYFRIDDITFLIYVAGTLKIRVFWQGFDAEWDNTAFRRTKRRLLNKLND